MSKRTLQKEVIDLYRPSVWGQTYHSLKHNEALGGGSVGPGKTQVLLMDPLEQIVVEDERAFNKSHPFHHGPGESVGWALHLRRTMPQVEQTIIRSHKIFPKLDPGAKYDAQKHTWKFRSGYRFQFGHCKDPSSWLDYYSSEFCVAKGTRILMADGSLRAIELILPGESVMTLEGPKRVSAWHSPGLKQCVLSLLVDADGRVLGEQVHPLSHPSLTTAGWRSSASLRSSLLSHEGFGVPRTYPDVAWQSYRSLLHEHQERAAMFASARAAGIYCAESYDARREGGPLVRSCDPSMLLLPALLLGALGTERESLLRARFRDSRGRRELLDSLGNCSRDCGLDGGPPLDRSGTDPASSRPPDDAAEHTLRDCISDGTERAPSHIHFLRGTYFHRYTKEERRGWGDIGCISSVMFPCGIQSVFDLTVEDANHYITESGLIASNTHLSFDELITFEEEQYDQIRTRVRTTDPVLGKMLKTRAMTNPVLTREMMENVTTKDPRWVWKRFVKPAPEGKQTLYRTIKLQDGTTERLTRIYLPATLYDNPDKEFVRRYEISLRDMKPHMQQALLFGNWNVAAGAFFGDDWDPRIHVCKPFKIPDDWVRFRSMDWGYKLPGCIHWWAMDEEGNLFCEREFMFRGMLAGQVAMRVAEIEDDLGLWHDGRSRITGPADTQLWEMRGSNAMSMAEEFLRLGVPWTKADKTSRNTNAKLLLKRLRDHQDFTMPPGICFFNSCTKAIETIPTMMAVPNDPEALQDGGDDHATDSCMYAAAYASRGRIGIAPKRSTDLDDEPEPVGSENGFGYGERW